jgi:hypothetical protein
MEEEEEDRYFPRCHSRVLRMDAHTHTHTHTHTHIFTAMKLSGVASGKVLYFCVLYFFFYTQVFTAMRLSGVASGKVLFFFLYFFCLHTGIHCDATERSCVWKSFVFLFFIFFCLHTGIHCDATERSCVWKSFIFFFKFIFFAQIFTAMRLSGVASGYIYIYIYIYIYSYSPRCDSVELRLEIFYIFFVYTQLFTMRLSGVASGKVSYFNFFFLHTGIHRDATQRSCVWKSFTPTNPGNFLIAICAIGVFMCVCRCWYCSCCVYMFVLFMGAFCITYLRGRCVYVCVYVFCIVCVCVNVFCIVCVCGLYCLCVWFVLFMCVLYLLFA